VILVTGSTGSIGQAVVRELVDRGAQVRALSRDAGRAASMFADSVDCVTGGFEDTASLEAAVRDVERVFVLCPIHPDLARYESAVVDAAIAAGVGQIVKLSTAGVEWVGQGPPEPMLWKLHRQSEEKIEQSGVPYTHLRPDACMQNILMFANPISIGVYPAPTGEGRRAWVDVRDVAAAAAVVLTEVGHEGRAYELTGPEALSDDDVAARLSIAIGRIVTHANPPLEIAIQNMIKGGMPSGMAEVIAEVMAAVAAGRAGKIASGVSDVTGRPPRSFDAFANEFRSLFTDI
jgi:uncharacterized protein YbjT (DUF2867 family)